MRQYIHIPRVDGEIARGKHSLPVKSANQDGFSIFLPPVGYSSSRNSGSAKCTSFGVILTIGPYCLCISVTRRKYLPPRHMS